MSDISKSGDIKSKRIDLESAKSNNTIEDVKSRKTTKTSIDNKRNHMDESKSIATKNESLRKSGTNEAKPTKQIEIKIQIPNEQFNENRRNVSTERKVQYQVKKENTRPHSAQPKTQYVPKSSSVSGSQSRQTGIKHDGFDQNESGKNAKQVWTPVQAHSESSKSQKGRVKAGYNVYQPPAKRG